MLMRMARGLLTNINYRCRFLLSLEDWLRQQTQEASRVPLIGVVLAAMIVDPIVGLITLVWVWQWPSLTAVALMIWAWCVVPLCTNGMVHWWQALKEADMFAAQAL